MLPDRWRHGNETVKQAKEAGRNLPWGWWQSCGGSLYDADQVEFMFAMERYMREHNRPFPDCADVLAVAKSLGYRRDGGKETDKENTNQPTAPRATGPEK